MNGEIEAWSRLFAAASPKEVAALIQKARRHRQLPAAIAGLIRSTKPQG